MKPIRPQTITRAQALHGTASLHPMALWVLMLATLLLMSVPRLAGAQDLLANARTQYQSAAYDEALNTLSQLAAKKDTLSPTDLRELEGRSVHEPDKAPEGRPSDYAAAIVDHATERRDALARYERARS